jgi:hypothetical protein
MGAMMDSNEHQTFLELVAAARLLSRTARLAATTISEEFEDMVLTPLDGLDAVLAKCPVIDDVTWDGTYSEDQVEEVLFTPDVPDELRAGRANTGVRLTHRITGQSVESYSSADVAQNRRRAHRSLKQRVEQRFKQTQDPLH